ncbi:MAG TPA: acyltransferase [Stellaceae bacterium]|nr:acyltransferase [Stellaceae bacterium]
MALRSLSFAGSRREAAPSLSRETSLYLDAVRFWAAVVVYLCHFSYRPISGGAFWQIGRYGPDAVVVFFVLSGFVIAHATARETSLSTYIVDRAARIYSVAFPAIVITLVCDLIGSWLEPHYLDGFYSVGSTWEQILTGLTFTNQFWGAKFVPGSDLPYWSLGYEVPYYAVFAAAIFARGAWRILVPVALLLVAGPSIAAVFPLWLAGVGLYRLGRLRCVPEALGWLLFCGSIALWFGCEFWMYQLGAHSPFNPGLAFDEHGRLPLTYFTGICFALNIVGIDAISHRFAWPLNWAARPIRWLAGRSFALYLVHFPVMKLAATMMAGRTASWPGRLFILSTTAAVVLLVAMLFESRKHAWRRFFAALLSGCRSFLRSMVARIWRTADA